MNNQRLLLRLILDELRRRGVEASIATFENRLTVQKAVYLLQEGGLPIGYAFAWNVRGPYSESLSRDLKEVEGGMKPHYDSLAKRYHLDKKLVAQVGGVVDTVGSSSGALEAAASARFLMRSENFNPEEALEKIIEMKPHLSSVKREGIIHYLESLQ